MATTNDNSSHTLITQALVCKALHTGYTLEEVEVTWDDARLKTQAIVEFAASGICQTDFHLTEGTIPATFPFIGGHEGAGKILHLPKEYKGSLSVGDTIVTTFESCSNCPNCQDSKPSQCYKLFLGNFVVEPTIAAFHPAIEDGVQFKLKKTGERLYADLFGQSSFIKVGAVDLTSLIKVPCTNLPPERLCAFGCGIQTGLGTVLNNLSNPVQRTFSHLPQWEDTSAELQTAGILPATPPQLQLASKQSIVIFGVGTVGCAGIIGARLSKCDTIIAVDVVDAKLDFAKQRAGATHTVNSSQFRDDPAGLVAHIRSLTPYGQGANMALEASGFPGVTDTAIRVLCTGGKAAIVGAGPDGIPLDVKHHEFLQNGWGVQGVFEGSSFPSVFLPYLIQLYAKGGEEWDAMEHLITTYKPTELSQILADIKSGKTIKAVIVW